MQFSDKDSSRLASFQSPQNLKALLTVQATLPGVPFIYYGNEIGMTDNPTLNKPLKYRTPMQWNSKGTGFSKHTPWLSRNPNYMTVNVEVKKKMLFNYSFMFTHILDWHLQHHYVVCTSCLFILNQQTERAIGDKYTTLKVYKNLQELREKESMQWGKMSVFRDGDLLMFTRKAEGFPGYLVAINFGTKRVTESFHGATGIPKEVKVVFHTHKDDSTAISLSDNSYILDPSHAVILEYE